MAVNTFGLTSNSLGRRKALDAIAETGRDLPCKVVAVTGAVVSVSFEVTDPVRTLPIVQMPVATSIYAREPIQIGDKGVAKAADAYLSGVTAMGGAPVVSMELPGNLAALSFHPLGRADWPAVDPNTHFIQGPKGVILQNMPPSGGNTSTLAIRAGNITATTPNFRTTGNLSAGNGVSGSFTDVNGKVITVLDGIVINISP